MIKLNQTKFSENFEKQTLAIMQHSLGRRLMSSLSNEKLPKNIKHLNIIKAIKEHK